MKTINLDRNKILGILGRELPSVKYNFHELSTLLDNKFLKNYFNNIRSLQEYPGLYNFLKGRGFDVTLCDRIKSELPHTRKRFLFNVKNIHSFVTNKRNLKGSCGITQSDLDFISYRFNIDVKLDQNLISKPTQKEVLSSIRGNTSIGLPNPNHRKSQYLSEISKVLKRFYTEDYSLRDIFYYPSATFLRVQIRVSGVKERVVHAVQVFQACIESFYYKYFTSGLASDSCITIGKTQLEISEIVKSYKGYYTYCFDFSKWDLTRQPILSIIAFELIRNSLQLTAYEDKFLSLCRNYYLTLPMFHPMLPLMRRYVGTVSGSGFTSLDNSLCNWIHMTILVKRYCESNGIDPYTFEYKINVCGDDLIMGFKFRIKESFFVARAASQFGSTMKLEINVVSPGNCRAFFLGSLWRNGKPFRPEAQLVASVVFGSGDFPKMNTYKLLQSRFIEVFGNSSDSLKYWKRLRMKPFKTIFFFNELFTPFQKGHSPRFDSNMEKSVTSSIDRRGFWYHNPLLSNKFKNLWKTR